MVFIIVYAVCLFGAFNIRTSTGHAKINQVKNHWTDKLRIYMEKHNELMNWAYTGSIKKLNCGNSGK